MNGTLLRSRQNFWFADHCGRIENNRVSSTALELHGLDVVCEDFMAYMDSDDGAVESS